MEKLMQWNASVWLCKLVAALGCVFVLATAGSAHATIINVNTTNTGWPSGSCAGPPAGPCCGLRQAIEAVNTQAAVGGCAAGNGNNDTIVLPAGTYVATSSLTISRAVTLDGNGVGSTVLRGNVATESAFFWVVPNLGDLVKFQELTVGSHVGVRAYDRYLRVPDLAAPPPGARRRLHAVRDHRR
jgi:hypothetical protein